MTTDTNPASARDMRSTKQTIYRLIAIYWDRYDLLVAAMAATDETIRETPDRQSAEKTQSEAGDALDEATWPILSYVPTQLVDAKIKHNFVDGLERRNGGLTSDEVSTLLASTENLIAWRSAQ